MFSKSGEAADSRTSHVTQTEDDREIEAVGKTADVNQEDDLKNAGGTDSKNGAASQEISDESSEADYDTEGHDGQKAVIEVVFNRVLSPDWPDTVKDVIYQKGQFATVKYLKHPYNLPGEHEDDAISAVLRETETVLPSTEYVYFDTRGINGRKHVRINHHVFGR